MRRLLMCCALLLALASPATTLAAEPGLNVPGADNGGNDEALAMLSDTGAAWARHFVEWDRFEPARGTYDTSIIARYKQTMDREAAIGVKTMLVVVRTPAWARDSDDVNAPPRDPKDFATFMEHLAREFAGRAEVYEIWNEQDEKIFWAGQVDAAQYTALLKEAYPAIKRVDPSVQVAFGPTTGNNYAYLEAAYTAGAKGYFDAVSVHTDTACSLTSPNEFYRQNGRIAQFTFLGYREVRASMLANGDDKPIFMSELGWSTTTTRCARGLWEGRKDAGVSEAKQATFLAQAYHCLAADPYVKIALWFEAKDRGAEDSELTRYGLRRPDGTNKPSYAVFKDVAKNGDRLTGPCGDFSPPNLVVRSPGPNRSFYDTFIFHAESTDKDVGRISFYVDGVEIENFTPKTRAGQATRDYVKDPAYRNWQGIRKLSFGPHTLKVVAKDFSGNESEQTLQFFRVNPATLPPQKTVFKAVRVAGSGRTRVVAGKLVSPGLGFGIQGKVRIVWQHKRKGAWKKIHGGMANANKAFRFAQKLKYKGQWRVRVEYVPVKPYKKAVSPWTTFTVG